jgi:hypothetical protein
MDHHCSDIGGDENATGVGGDTQNFGIGGAVRNYACGMPESIEGSRRRKPLTMSGSSLDTAGTSAWHECPRYLCSILRTAA